MKTSWTFQLALLLGMSLAGTATVSGQQQQPVGKNYLVQSPQVTTSGNQQPMTRQVANIVQAIETSGQPAPQPVNSWSGVQGYDSSSAGCGSGCDAGCSTGCNSGCGGFRFLKPSDYCFDDFISPISNPVYFEDPRNLTEARGVFVQHRVPQAAGGGSVQLYAIQLRAKLTENVSLIAVKDGFFTSTNALVDDGWANTAAGLKFNLIRDPQAQRLLSSGFTFEMPTGEASALQGTGSGILNLFIASGKGFLDNRAHWVSTSGFRQPFDSTDNSTVAYSSHHFDYKVRPRTYLLTEFNVQKWTKSGGGGINGVEGFDLFNLGSTGVAGNTIVTQAVGLKFKPHRRSEIGAAFEFPLTERRDIIDNRINVNWIWRY